MRVGTGVQERIVERLGAGIVRMSGMSGGCVGEVYACALDDGREVVVKVESGGAGALDIEAYMLRYLAEHSDLPVPGVLVGEPGLLVMERIEGSTGASGAKAQEHAADLLIALHGVTADQFGLERDTLIGGLHQPNGWMDSWVAFFAERRLIEMARQARDAGRMDAATQDRVAACAQRLGELIDEPDAPSLIHGDIWSGNIMSAGGRVTGFIDPAVYYAHPEVELAFITLFGTLGRAFFERYQESRPIPDGFERRCTVYNLYPLLVHTRLFGGGYLSQVESSLRRLGF